MTGRIRRGQWVTLCAGWYCTLGSTLDLNVQAGLQFHAAPGHQDPGTFVNVSVLMTL